MKSIQDLIQTFGGLVQTNNIEEKYFVIFNGKIKKENFSGRSIEIKLSYVKQNDNRFIILLIRDTTQRDLVLTLDATNKYKDHLLASVSHELRTPLNGNINLLEVAISEESVPKNTKNNLLIPALKSSMFLLNIINDFLDFSQIKAHSTLR